MGLNIESTKSESVKIINFEIPQLGRTRKIWIYLPNDYDTTDRRYPVFYMHDAQNLFDQSTSVFGVDWQVDDSLNTLQKSGDFGIIAVGIEHGDRKRIDELSPWVHPKVGGGEGDLYIQFIIETLKPFIDKNFRSRPSREYTGILGSSMGGLISLYAGIKYQAYFSRVGVFSPALWFSEEIYKLVRKQEKSEPMRIYLMGGKHESPYMKKNLIRMYTTLKESNYQDKEVKLVLKEDGEHSEWFWRREFPKAYLWLFREKKPSIFSNDEKIRLTPTPAIDHVKITTKEVVSQALIEIFDRAGKLKLSKKVSLEAPLNVSFLDSGRYQIRVTANGKCWFKELIKE